MTTIQAIYFSACNLFYNISDKYLIHKFEMMNFFAFVISINISNYQFLLFQNFHFFRNLFTFSFCNQIWSYLIVKMDTERAEQPPNEVDEIEQEDSISIPNWLIEALEWIERMEMADSKLSTSSWAFNELCGPKLHGREVKPHFVKWMWIAGEEDESGILQAEIADDKYKVWHVPLPNVPPPDYILGFKKINICYLDARVLEFLSCIAPKLNDVQFNMATSGIGGWGTKEEDKRTAMIDSLLNILANKIEQFEMDMVINFAKFNALFPGFIDQINSIFIYLNGGIDFGFLYKWLTDRKENEGNKQKILELLHNEEFLWGFFGRVKKEFANATDPVNFLIHFCGFRFVFDFGEFTRENEKTGEVLVAYQYQKQFGGQNIRLLLRCPKGEEERWKEEGEKKLFVNRYKDATKLLVKIGKFGAFNNMA